ncbi:hypothetical protein OIU76_013096 [Salix suchowensis]|nr:hypothetical protein OIU76_013096 [Salix suchowensis]
MGLSSSINSSLGAAVTWPCPGEICGGRWHMRRACMRVRGNVRRGTHLSLHVQNRRWDVSPRADRHGTANHFTVYPWDPRSESMPAGNAVSRYFDAGSHVVLSGDLCVNRLFRFGLVIGCHVSRLTSVRRKCPRGIVFITFLGHVTRVVIPGGFKRRAVQVLI